MTPQGKLRLLIYGLNYAPEEVGVGKYSSEMARWLAARGQHVSVITAPPHFPDWAVRAPYRGGAYRREELAGVVVQRCPIWMPRRLTALTRILACLSFVATSLPKLLSGLMQKPDLLIVIQPSFFSIPPAWLFGKIFRVPVWLHVQDFELAAAAGAGYVSDGVAARAVAGLERFLMRRLFRVSTISEQMRRQLDRLGVVPERQVLFPNWVDCNAIRPLDLRSPWCERLGIAADQQVALYAGTFGRKQGLEVLIELARLLADRQDLVFVLCGEGLEGPALRAAATDLSNIRWLPLQPLEHLNELLNLADIHLLPQKPGVAEAVLPSKLTGMFASGRPVLATAEAHTDLARLVMQAGVAVPPGDCKALRDALLGLLDDPARRQALGEAARAYALSHFDREPLLLRFEAELRRATEPQTRR